MKAVAFLLFGAIGGLARGLLGAPEQMTIEGWNEDDIHDHTIMFLFLVLPKWMVWPQIMLTKIMEGFMRLMV
ncbi:unnamed protein product [marine sediment metagenome]|uniref:Uncharacterized protein n=1 Tax=marine sediment metagenome TaxID=412755 RepID=X1RIJ2_9ZZZZ